MAGKPWHHFAFLVGNDAYGPPLGRLTKCVQDATDMRDCLLELGYPRGNVRCVFDGTRDQIVDAFREFYPMVRSSPRATVFVFLAGHGLESGAENGFLGVDCVDVASVEGAGACWFFCFFSVTRW
ncbi:MAG: caspase family protein [Limnohabitans sp.]